MIKISHETPIGLLEESLLFNDYQYCLVHLLEEQPEYLKHFEQCRDNNVHVLLDNSIFELGESFDPERFAYWVDRLRPDEYIVPDSLENSEKTIANLLNWVSKYKDLPGDKIGVVQGKTISEIVKCYEVVDRHCDKIAISFDYSLYEKLYSHSNKLVSWCMGRVRLLDMLVQSGVINTKKPHHLLGCSLPLEFSFYKNYPWIQSLDTSNPVVHGLLGIPYQENGLLSKKSIKLFQLINHKIENKQLIMDNVMKFSKLVNN